MPDTAEQDIYHCYAIRRWHELYEPPSAAKPRGENAGAPLPYVKLLVRGHAHDLSGDYRELMSHKEGPAAFGLFTKLLELAGNEPEGPRDGTIYTHRTRRRGMPASAADIAFYSLFPLELVEACLHILVEVGWLERAPYNAGPRARSEQTPAAHATRPDHDASVPEARSDARSERAASAHESRTDARSERAQIAQACALPARIDRALTETVTETETGTGTRTETETGTATPTETPGEREPDGNTTPAAADHATGPPTLDASASASKLRVLRTSVPVSASGRGRRAPPPGPPPHEPDALEPPDDAFLAQARRHTAADIYQALGIRPGKHEADDTTLGRMVDHYLDLPTRGEVRRRWRELTRLATEKARSRLDNKLAGFIAACKRAWGTWPEHRDNLPEAARPLVAESA